MNPEHLDPAILVIFGITGDLAKKKLLPALYHLLKNNLLHEKTVILGVSRQGIDSDQLLGDVELCINEVDKVCDPEGMQKMRAHLQMHSMNVSDPSSYDELLALLNSIEEQNGVCMNRLYYLSVPPNATGEIIKNLGEHGLNSTCPHAAASTRLLLEKPFGFDVASATSLIEETNRYFGEEQIFRIDHYLAKEMAQNITTFRFSNPVFQAVWNNQSIKRITITAAETIGIENRVTFYEETGALRDLIQSHLLQLLALVTMEEPQSSLSDDLHNAHHQLLSKVSLLKGGVNIRGQYNGYRQEVKNDSSTTETFAAIQLQINQPEWEGVPIHIVTGKALSEKRTTINIQFENAAHAEHNHLRFRIQPNEGIELDLHVKEPGYDDRRELTTMNFSYQSTFADPEHPNAYERVLVDAARGDRSLFAAAEEVLASWKIIQPILDAWHAEDASTLRTYEPGATIQSIIGKQ